MCIDTHVKQLKV